MSGRLSPATLLVPAFAQPVPRVQALCTTRRGGVSRPPYDDGAGGGGLNLGTHVQDDPLAVEENRRRLRELLPAEPAWLTQVHGNLVVDAAQLQGSLPQADASLTSAPHVVCVVQTADCLPVLFCDVQGKVVAAAHAGWRGLLAGVLQQTVTGMRRAGATEILAWLGPAIGPKCFEVGQEVRAAFVAADPQAASAFRAVPTQSGKYLADIYALARLALTDVGVRQVTGGTRCTVSEPEDFYSYRRDGITGRIAALIWIN